MKSIVFMVKIANDRNQEGKTRIQTQETRKYTRCSTDVEFFV